MAVLPPDPVFNLRNSEMGPVVNYIMLRDMITTFTKCG